MRFDGRNRSDHFRLGIDHYFDNVRPVQRITFRFMPDPESMTEKWRVKPRSINSDKVHTRLRRGERGLPVSQDTISWCN